MTFITEAKKIELSLELETRKLPLPDGRWRYASMMRSQWEQFDLATTKLGVTRRELTGWAEGQLAEKPKLEFEQLLRWRARHEITLARQVLDRFEACFDRMSAKQIRDAREFLDQRWASMEKHCRRGEAEGF